LDEEAWDGLPHLKRLTDEISGRPAGQRAVAMKDRHQFKLEMDAEANRYMFPSNVDAG
jgi:GST-like protein